MSGRLARIVGRWIPAILAIAVVAGVVGPAGSGAAASTRSSTSNLEVMLVIDVSASMRPAIDAAKAAAEQFIDSMPEAVSIGLQTFGDRVTVLTTPTTDRELLRELIGGIRLEDDTALYDAVVVAAGQFTPTVPERVIVLLSDGKDEGSQAPLDYAVASLQGIRVEAISLTTKQTDLASLSALGSVTPADDAAGMSAAFERVSGLLAAVVVTVPPTTAPSATAAPSSTTPPTAAPTTAPPTSVATTAVPVVAASTSIEDENSSSSLLLGGSAVFLGLFLLVLFVFPEPRVSKSRLGIADARSGPNLGQRTAVALEGALERRGKRNEFATSLAVAGISMRPGEYLGMVAAVALVCGLLGLLVGGLLLAVVIALAVYAGARWYVAQRTSKRRAQFAEQLPDVLQLLTTALRSGFGLAQALETVADEVEEPSKSEFAQVLVEGRLGRDLPGAMRGLARRMKSEDLEWVVGAMDINRDVGGNLSEVLSTVGSTIRERQRMARQVATYTAEGRLSARVLTVMPFVMALWQWRSNPDNFERLTSGGGLVALVIAGVLLVLGSIWTRRIVNSISA